MNGQSTDVMPAFSIVGYTMRDLTRARRQTLSVARSLSGRVGAGEMLLSSMRPLSDGSFELLAQWPRQCPDNAAPEQDAEMLLVVETLRQAAIAVARGHFGAAHDAVFLLSRSAAELHAPRPLRTTAEKVVVTADVDRVREIGGAVVSFRLTVSLRLGRVRYADADAHVRVVSRGDYARLRDGARRSDELACAGAPDALPGLRLQRSFEDRHRPGNTWRLDIGSARSAHFARPRDHLPITLLLAAVGVAGRELTGWADASVAAMDLTFPDFLELDRPACVTLCPLRTTEQSARFAVFFEQDDAPAVVGEITLTR